MAWIRQKHNLQTQGTFLDFFFHLQKRRMLHKCNVHRREVSTWASLPVPYSILPHNSKQQCLAELKQLPHDRWFKLLLSHKVGLSGQTVLRPRLCPKEAGYEKYYCTYLSIFLNNFWGEIIWECCQLIVIALLYCNISPIGLWKKCIDVLTT